MKGFDLENVAEVNQSESKNLPEVKSTTTVSKPENDSTTTNSPQTITQAAAQHFGKMLELAGGLVEIKKMKVASEAVLAKMKADIELLRAETEKYVDMMNASTRSAVDRMNVIRLMMQDYNQQSSPNITSEDFKDIITKTIEDLGRMKNE